MFSLIIYSKKFYIYEKFTYDKYKITYKINDQETKEKFLENLKKFIINPYDNKLFCDQKNIEIIKNKFKKIINIKKIIQFKKIKLINFIQDSLILNKKARKIFKKISDDFEYPSTNISFYIILISLLTESTKFKWNKTLLIDSNNNNYKINVDIYFKNINLICILDDNKLNQKNINFNIIFLKNKSIKELKKDLKEKNLYKKNPILKILKNPLKKINWINKSFDQKEFIKQVYYELLQ